MLLPFQPITKPNLVLVEGPDDKEIISNLLGYLHLRADVDIREVMGKENFRDGIDLISKRPDFKTFVKSLVIIRDADTDAASAFQSIHNALSAAKLPTPREPEITLKDFPFVSVFIAPDNKRAGSLESLCMGAISDQAALGCVTDFLRCAADAGLALRQPEKTKFYAYLATRPYPVKSIYAAIEGNHISLDHAAFSRLRDFLSRACFVS